MWSIDDEGADDAAVGDDGIYLVVLAKIQGEIALCRRLADQFDLSSEDACSLLDIADFLERRSRLVDGARLDPFPVDAAGGPMTPPGAIGIPGETRGDASA
jgi:hypothetical protein